MGEPPRIRRADARVFRLDASLSPALRVRPGDAFVVETDDASGGLLSDGTETPTPANAPYLLASPVKANPVGGPVYVEGVRAGERLRVEVVGIQLAPHGAVWSRPTASPLGRRSDWPEINEPFAARVDHVAGEAVLSPRLRWPLAPMIGTLACAPEWEARSTSLGQGPWGGNLDAADCAPGAVVTLSTYHDGGLLFVGDVHGCQGDGEYNGIADESRAEVTLRAYPAQGEALPFPRIETDDRVIALYCDRPLEAAARGATEHLLRWLVDEFEFTPRDAYLAVSLHPEFRLRVYQMTAVKGLEYTVGASLPRTLLP